MGLSDTCLVWSDAGQLMLAPEVPAAESSGVAASALEPGLYFTHNDAGNAASLYLFDQDGTYRYAQVVTGATNTDWEDLAAAPCPDAAGGEENACLYIGDIGDNLDDRASITLWVVPESTDMLVDATACTLVYEDGPRDAETLLVGPDRTVRVVTKEADGEAKVYLAGSLTCGDEPDLLRLEAELTLDGPATGGTMSEYTAIIRTHTTAYIWQECGAIDATTWISAPDTTDLASDPKGEGVTLTAEGAMLTTSEDGTDDGAGLLFRVTECTERGEPKCSGCSCTTPPIPEFPTALALVAAGFLVRGRRASGATN
ncbi:MAG: hypothetical protein EXR69_14595 [Myxococcales bacterium]|nr:hypothetical protein [Myxococcales bacterium]